MIYVLPTESGTWYKLNEPALQYLVADAESWEQTAKVWEDAYNEQAASYRDYVRSSKARLEQLRADIDKERGEWKAKVRRARTSPGLGVFGGYGVQGWTIGVGLVWRVM